MEKSKYNAILTTLIDELKPAMGCTEPIAVAYSAAIARKTLGCLPEKVVVEVSGNILKNVKSVIVPNTGGLKGVAAAVAAGIVAGEADSKLEVLSNVTNEQIRDIANYLQNTPIEVKHADTTFIFDIAVTVFGGGHKAYSRITERHTHVVLVSFDDQVISSDSSRCGESETKFDMPISDIFEFVENVDICDIEPYISRQIEYNTAISNEGLSGNYGASVGKTLLKMFGNDIHIRARAAAAAGSDARMNGCPLPVVIVSGSGNQGITACMPVVTYANEIGVFRDKLLKAVCLSDLVTIHLKSDIGSLSAYCGAVSAGVGAAAGICYLYGGGRKEIEHTIVNALAINSGIICDGAKSSCAAKISSAVDAGLVGLEMTRCGKEFLGGDGIVEKGVENTIHNVGDVARLGMRATDVEIIKIMIKS